MNRGPKPDPKRQPRCPLNTRAPSWLSAEAKALYKEIATALAAEGYACEIDAGAVALLANAERRYQHLLAEEALLQSSIVDTDKGPKAHPLLALVRGAENQLKELYAQLLMTPRSRTAARMTESARRAAPVQGIIPRNRGGGKSPFYDGDGLDKYRTHRG